MGQSNERLPILVQHFFDFLGAELDPGIFRFFARLGDMTARHLE